MDISCSHTCIPCSAIPTDIDECAVSTDNCNDNARCINTMGSFECECLPGYTGDGVTCEGQSLVILLASTELAQRDSTFHHTYFHTLILAYLIQPYPQI